MAEDWTIERFNENMIRLKNGAQKLTLQAQQSGGYAFQDIHENEKHQLIWDGDVVRLTVTKYDDDESVTMELSQRNNGFPIALFVGLHPELWDKFHSYSEHPVDDSELEDPSGGRRKTFRKHRLMSKKYCKKTPCRKMGFTQKASCRPYKNCYQ